MGDDHADFRPLSERVTAVVATRNRANSLRRTVDNLLALRAPPAVIVVDNASTDGTENELRRRRRDVDYVRLPENEGAYARTLGARRIRTPYIAFCDDDSWWLPGSLERAASLLDRYERLAVVAARVVLGPDEEDDPTCADMASSPLVGRSELPGPFVLGFIACGAVLRRSAFLAAGGFHPRFGVGGEEQLLAVDLAGAGWELAYVDDVVARHDPSPSRDHDRRLGVVARNELWLAWLRRPAADAARVTFRAARRAVRDSAARAGLAEALRGLPWVARERRSVPPSLGRALRVLEATA